MFYYIKQSSTRSEDIILEVTMRYSKIILILLAFSNISIGQDLIIDNETVFLKGEHVYQNVIIRNNGILSLVQYGGSDNEQGQLILYADSLFIDSSSAIIGEGAGGDYGGGPNREGQGGVGGSPSNVPGGYPGGGGGGLRRP